MRHKIVIEQDIKTAQDVTLLFHQVMLFMFGVASAGNIFSPEEYVRLVGDQFFTHALALKVAHAQGVLGDDVDTSTPEFKERIRLATLKYIAEEYRVFHALMIKKERW